MILHKTASNNLNSLKLKCEVCFIVVVYRNAAAFLESSSFKRMWAIRVKNHRTSVGIIVFLVK